MSTQSYKIAVADLLEAVSSSIKEIRKTHTGLITIVCPTNTSSVFLRRQYEASNKNSLGIRFTTVNEITLLLEDASQENSLLSKSSSIPHFDNCVAIARKLFPSSSAWVKAPLIRSTLELLYSMDDEHCEQALNDYEIVSKCFDEYSQLMPTKTTSLAISIPAEEIIGKCILIDFENLSHTAQRFRSRYAQHIYCDVLMENKHSATDVNIFENAFCEVESVLESICSIDELKLDNCVLIVPDNKYKLLAMAIADLKGIPLAGSSPSTLATHPFSELSRYFLSTSERFTSRETVSEFVEKFPWIKNPSGKHPFFETLNKIKHGTSVGEHFTAITEFISTNIRPEFFVEENKDSPEQQFSQDAFSLLAELSSSTSEFSTAESLMLLEQQARKKPLRIGALGSGIYLALPSEVFGSSFEHAFVCSMSDSYFSPAQLKSSLIPRDQYERYELSGKRERELETQKVLSWLRNCSEDIHLSSNKIGIDGKTTVLPYWAKIKNIDTTESFLNNFEWDKAIESSTDFVLKLLSHEMNNVNSLANIESALPISATGLEDIAQCPSKFFHKRILKETKPLFNEDPDEILPIILGRFVHDLFEDYVSQGLTEAELANNVHLKIVEMEREGELPHSASGTITIEKLTRIIENFIKLHKDAEAESIEVEVPVEKEVLSGDLKVDLRGKIDRIQRNSQGTTLVDYKTGKLEKSGDIFHLGRKLQLALYAMIREEHTNALEYWHISENEGLIDPIEWNDDAKTRARQILEPLVKIANTGTFIPREEFVEFKPKGAKHNSRCSTCELDPYCYQEQRLIWRNNKSATNIEAYAIATGESEIEVDVQ